MTAQSRSLVTGFLLGALAVALVLAAGAAAALHGGFSARSKPGAVETWLAHFALAHSVPADDRALRNPVTPTAATLAEARDHYADHCANCHANNGDGHTMYGDGLNPAPPDLRLPATQNKTDGELYSIIQNGVRMTGMPAFGAPGNEDELTWKLVAFIRHLPALTPAEEQAMRKANPITPSELEEQQEEDNFLNGTPAEPKGHKP
jgi:mono/diheme cytochrome c family protein